MLSGMDTLLKKYICASCVCLRNTEMDKEQGEQENGFTSQEVEEIVFLDEIEKEWQYAGIWKKSRRYHEPICGVPEERRGSLPPSLRCNSKVHVNVDVKNRANMMKTQQQEGEDDIAERRNQLQQIRNTIQERVRVNWWNDW